jgi:rubrerythrin
LGKNPFLKILADEEEHVDTFDALLRKYGFESHPRPRGLLRHEGDPLIRPLAATPDTVSRITPGGGLQGWSYHRKNPRAVKGFF